MNRKHFVIYLRNGTLNQTTPKNWARANQGGFPKFKFANANDTPTTDEIEAYLIAKQNFKMLADKNLVVCYKF
jgi:hypothetical protein